MSVFRNLPAHPFQLGGYWRVALAKMFQPAPNILPQSVFTTTLPQYEQNLRWQSAVLFFLTEIIGETMQLFRQKTPTVESILKVFIERARFY